MPAPLLAVFDDGQGNVYHAELQVGDQALIMINGVNSALRVGEPLTLGAASAGAFVWTFATYRTSLGCYP